MPPDFSHSEFENEMRQALRHEPPPADFASRVLAKTGKPEPALVRRRQSSLLPWALAACLAIGVAVPAEIYRQNYRKQEKAIQAARQLITALNITRTKLKQTRERVQRRSHRI